MSRVTPASGARASALSGLRVSGYAMLAGVLLASAGLVTIVAPTDPDVWWHLRNGKLILDSGIPTHDVYSFTALGRPWIVQEWLTEVLMYLAKSFGGYGLLTLLFGALQSAASFVIYKLVRLSGAGRLLSLLLIAIFMLFSAGSWGVRPQVLTPLFLGLFALVLHSYKRDPGRARLLVILPPLSALWANLHASYFMGIVLIGAFLVGEFLNALVLRQKMGNRLRPLLLALGGCFVATLANPYGVTLWSYPLTYLLNGGSNPLIKYTQEWQPPDLHEPPGLLFAATLILLAITGLWVAARRTSETAETAKTSKASKASKAPNLLRQVDFTYLIIFAGFTALAVQAVRLLPVYGAMVLPLLGLSISRAWPVLSAEHDTRTSRAEVKSRLNIVVGLALVSLLAGVLASRPEAQLSGEPRTDTDYTCPVAATDYVARVSGPVRMYNKFTWGGYLIYRLYPQHLVFIDGRADMYREGIFEDSMTLENAAPGWREVLARYRVNLVLIPPDSPLAYALANEPGWTLQYSDPVAEVYATAAGR